ncbi:MAG: hypothetical protein AAF646_11790 [Pseudomonadota bacterium]
MRYQSVALQRESTAERRLSGHLNLLTLDDSQPAERVGYFKSDTGPLTTRIVAYASPEPLTADEARAVLSRTMVSDGSISVSTIYFPGAPHPGAALTTAATTAEALAFLDPTGEFGGWAYRLWVNDASGEARFDAHP